MPKTERKTIDVYKVARNWKEISWLSTPEKAADFILAGLDAEERAILNRDGLVKKIRTIRVKADFRVLGASVEKIIVR